MRADQSRRTKSYRAYRRWLARERLFNNTADALFEQNRTPYEQARADSFLHGIGVVQVTEGGVERVDPWSIRYA